MTEEPKKPASKIEVGRDNKPCGCVITEYGDGSKQLAPCIPCGLAASAQNLHAAAQAMAGAADAMLAVATTVRRQEGQAAVAAAAVRSARGPRPLS